MKFLLSLALFVAAGVSAQTVVTPASPSSTVCAADYIVTNCLDTENNKVKACDPTNYACLCEAYQAVVTCYNNCPNDPRAPSAQNQASIYCRTASELATTSTNTIHATASTPSQAATTPANTDGSSATKTSAPASTSSGFSSGQKNAAAGLVNNAGNVFLAIAGALAAML